MTPRDGLRNGFLEMTGLSPDLASAMRSAESVTPFRSEADYSYSMDQFVGDGFLMVGDAARFVDPIFSSGVSVACYSAKFACAAIVQALETGDLSRASLQLSITKVYPPPRHQGNSPILGDIIISSLSGFVGFGWENFSQPVSSLEV